MIAWLTDTMIYTGALIALVLVLRRPVARHFGPQMSYALWALPLLRFVMPPVVLPASFAPQSAGETMTVMTMVVTNTETAATGAVGADVPLETVAPLGSVLPVPVYQPPSFWDSWGGLMIDAALAAWLVGAVVFLAWRAWTYFRMRDWLLDGARPVGESGSVRLVETAAVSSPVAFGVSDKVVALPVGFMASENRAARDLAIEHELAHHRGWDLLANILAQPILALHWFNPLAWMGWRAMRRDQEAACDARVIAARGQSERAVYGQVIASFASGQRLALAAPMACPVLGEKSIIHRLRSLSMTDVSPRRRMMGRVLLVSAALAVPSTASISYAEASATPRAPEAPAMPRAPRAAITIVDVPEGADPSDAKLHTRVIEKDGQTIILKTSKPLSDEEARAKADKATASMEGAFGRFTDTPTFEQRQALAKLRHSMNDAEWAEYNAKWAKYGQAWAKKGEDAAKFGQAMGEWGDQFSKQWEAWGEQFGKGFAPATAPAAPRAPSALRAPTGPRAPVAPVAVNVQVAPVYAYSYNYGCDEDGNLVQIQAIPGNTANPPHMTKCHRVADANANARRALVQARARIQGDRSMNEDVRDQVLDSLDREIDRLEDASEANS